ncbi:MAG: polyprenyl synthetase family protein [Deltaproteobacteria bacterium]|jgi:geranylgeranyl pyrophosphate synthase|nr:polyprenyl synthetase family protein [Deltaproteobacteria bacterium]
MSAPENHGEAFLNWRQERLEAVNAFLARLFDDLKKHRSPAIQNLCLAMEHAVLNGGKRLRPLFAAASARSLKISEELGLRVGAAVELMHSYSLIHDDLPSLDDDSVRRGKPSCHMAFGEATAVLAGDALQSLAFETLSGCRGVPSSRVLAAVALLARACGPVGMVGGQAEDLAFENQSPKEEERFSMARKKTGELIAAALSIPALLALGKKKAATPFRLAGLYLGSAFQIQDDLLNSLGDPRRLGKAVGTDASRGKASILNYLAPNEAEMEAENLRRRAVQLLRPVNSDPQEMIFRLIDSLSNRES